MKINLRQENAMWVLGLLWTGLGLAAVVGTEREGLEGAAFTIVMLLILLVPVCLIIQSSHPSQTGQRRANQRLEAEGSVYRCTHVRCVRLKPGQRFCASETGSPHRQVIAEGVSRVAVLSIGQGNPTRFRGVRVGFDVAIKTGAFDSEATAA